MPPGKYGMQEEWEKEGDQRIVMDFLLPTGIFLKFAVAQNDTIKTIKKVQLLPAYAAMQKGILLCVEDYEIGDDPPTPPPPPHPRWY